MAGWLDWWRKAVGWVSSPEQQWQGDATVDAETVAHARSRPTVARAQKRATIAAANKRATVARAR